MPELNRQKSTFSGGPQGECLHSAIAPQGLAGLLHHLRTRTHHS
ncbi:hypothetical protein [Streptomyces phaeochromogenes]